MFTQRLIVREAHESLSEVFSAMDLDNDGVLSESDFKQSFKFYYQNHPQVQSVDSDDDYCDYQDVAQH